MCKKIFFLFLACFCFLQAVPALEITESELAMLETLQQTQLQALAESKAALIQSTELLMLSNKNYGMALQRLKAAESLTQTQCTQCTQCTQLEQLKAQSLKQSDLIKKSAILLSELESEKIKKEAELETHIRVLTIVVVILSGILLLVIVFAVIKRKVKL